MRVAVLDRHPGALSDDLGGNIAQDFALDNRIQGGVRGRSVVSYILGLADQSSSSIRIVRARVRAKSVMPSSVLRVSLPNRDPLSKQIL